MDLVPAVKRLKIVLANTAVVPLASVLNEPQLHLLATIGEIVKANRPVRIVVLKARQLGLSTVIEAVLFLLSLSLPRMNSLVISHDKDSARHLKSMTDHYWDTYWAKRLYSTSLNNRDMIEWDHNSSSLQVATAGNLSAGRSFTFQALHASEVAFWPNASTLMTGLMQTLPDIPFTFAFLESTANGVGGYYYDTYQAAASGDSEYIPVFYPWFTVSKYSFPGAPHIPDYRLDAEERILRRIGVSNAHLAWRRYAIVNKTGGSLDRFHQEYPSCVVAGTRVATSQGLLPVEEITPGTQTPYGEVEAVLTQPPARCVRLTTLSGLQLDCTWHHPMVIANQETLIPAASTLGMDLELAAMDHAWTPATHTWNDGLVDYTVRMDDNLALFTGYFMGDGYFKDGNISIVSDGKDQDVVEEIVELLINMKLNAYTRVVGTKGGGVEIRASAKRLVEPFVQLGFAARRTESLGPQRNVVVPEIIWRSTEEHRRLFLAGLFEADGFSNKAQWDVRLFTRHEQFARDVQLLLLTFGIHANVYGEQTGWVVKLGGVEASNFHNRIGFRSARKSSATPPSKCQAMRGRRLEVVSVEELGELPSYDLTIAGRPYFGANGLLTHNSPDEAFITSGTNVFPIGDLDLVYKPTEPERGMLLREPAGSNTIRFHVDPHAYTENQPFRVYRRPHPGASYIVSGDPTRTISGDNACIQVIDRRTQEVVAQWRGKTDPSSFGDRIIEVGIYYNWALITLEINGPGSATIQRILTRDYPNVWQDQKADKDPGTLGHNYGWHSSQGRKNEAIGHLLRAVVEHDIVIHDADTYREMKNYITLDGGRFGNNSNEAHDDCVTSLAIGLTCLLYDAGNLESLPPGARPENNYQSVNPMKPQPRNIEVAGSDLILPDQHAPLPPWEQWEQRDAIDIGEYDPNL